MKKLFTLLAAIVTAFSAMATTFTIGSANSVTQDGITVSFSKGSGNNDPAVYNGCLRLYAKNTITISGSKLSNISLSFTKQGSKEYATLSASTGSLVSGGESTSNDDVKTDKWSGSASSVTFTLGDSGQRIITKIVVNGDGSETDPSQPDEPDQPGDEPDELDPDYKYDEPTVVTTPGNTVQGDAYSFISNNVMVSCTKGAVNETYFSAHAGFDMTFTATQEIKGIVINGFVKKDFTATTNHGQISYLTPSEDKDANPVVVLTNVDSKSVTISCVKQLRCYEVEVYFEENPEATVSGGATGDGGEENLVFDSADAVYESEYSEAWGEDNYSVFLYNASSPDIPYVALDLWPGDSSDLTGTYSWDDYTLGDYTYYAWGEGDYDATFAEGGEFTVTKSGDVYTIKGYFIGEDNVTYNVSFTGKMQFYTDDEYYYGDDDSSVEDVIAEESVKGLDTDETMYDLRGVKVVKGYRGVVIQNGKKYLLR